MQTISIQIITVTNLAIWALNFGWGCGRIDKGDLFFSFYGAGHQTQGFRHGRQVLSYLSFLSPSCFGAFFKAWRVGETWPSLVTLGHFLVSCCVSEF